MLDAAHACHCELMLITTDSCIKRNVQTDKEDMRILGGGLHRYCQGTTTLAIGTAKHAVVPVVCAFRPKCAWFCIRVEHVFLDSVGQ